MPKLSSNYSGVLIVDLDGTLIRGNTYKYLVKALLRQRPSFLQFFDLALFGSVVVRRKLGLADRIAMKRVVQKMSHRVFVTDSSNKALQTFLDALEKDVNQDVSAAIEKAKNKGFYVMLATAALPEYALPLARKLNIDPVLATSAFGQENWQENLGVVKRDNVLNHLKEIGLDSLRRILLTDHEDDLPLAHVCDQTFWVVEFLSHPLDYNGSQRFEADSLLFLDK